MELEFDKEIDSLLRKSGEGGRGVLVGDKPGEKPKVHLDVDQLAAFAENAVPEKPRALYMAHLADCDRCRRILSGLIALNAEAEPAEERIVAPAISPVLAEPWYRKFLFPNLAYVMGGLVLVFGGLIAISVLQSSNREASTVSQTFDQAPAASGPMAEEPQLMMDQVPSNTNANAAASNGMIAQAPYSSANASANAANTASNRTVAGKDLDLTRKEAAPRDQPGFTLDGATAAKPAVAAPPPPALAAPKNETAETTTDKVAGAAASKDDAKKASVVEKRKVEDVEIDARQVQNLPRTQAGGKAKSVPGPSRNAQQNFPNRADNTFELYEERRISGKGFQRKNNVWYDNSYRGQSTINVRRGTEEYRKLDSGLRTIAESLSGVVVVMWDGKAYRIQ